MLLTRRAVWLLCIVVLGAAPAMAQAQPAAPTVESILAKYVRALGGRDAILKLTSRTMVGSFQMDGADRGTVDIVYKAPNLHRSVISVPGYGVLDSGLDSAGGWEKGPDQPLHALSGVDLSRSRREADLHKAAKIAQLYKSVSLKGKGKAGERDAWLVTAVPAEGHPETMYFDAETGLLVRVDLQVEAEGKLTAVERHYEDYRPVGGVMVAHLVRFVNPGINYALRFSEVKHNVPIDPSKLARPAN